MIDNCWINENPGQITNVVFVQFNVFPQRAHPVFAQIMVEVFDSIKTMYNYNMSSGTRCMRKDMLQIKCITVNRN